MNAYVRPATVQWGDRAAAWSVFLILLAVYTATFTGLPDNPDAEVEYQTTSALVRTGSLALSGTPEANGIVQSEFNVVPGGPQRSGKHYSWFGVGQALAAVPFYLVGRGMAWAWPEIEERHAADQAWGFARSEYFAHLVVGWRNPVLGALTGLLLVLVARRLGVRRATAWTCALAYGLTTFAFAQARSTLSDVQATAFLFAAFHGLLVARESFARLTPPRSRVLWFVGAALGAAFLTRVATAPAVLVLGFSAWRTLGLGHERLRRAFEDRPSMPRERLARQRFDLLVPLVLALAGFAIVNALRFSNPWTTGYERAVLGGGFFSYPALAGSAGILFSPGRGLLWMAPALLLVPFGVVQARAHNERLWPRILALLVLAIAGPVVFMPGWHGAWTYGPRYVLPLMPFAWVGVGLALESRRARPWIGPAAWALFALGLVVQVPGALVDPGAQQDLAMQAAREAWPEIEGASDAERENARFERTLWDWRFAAPWAHWRILRHRVAGLGESFLARDLYFVDSDRVLTPAHARELGMRHLAWVDLSERLGGRSWPAVLLCVLLLGFGLGLGTEALERSGTG